VTEQITLEKPKEQQGEEKLLNWTPSKESQKRKEQDPPEEPPKQYPFIPETAE